MGRAWQILRVAARYRLDALLTPDILDALGVPWWQRALLRLNPARLISTKGRSDGERLRLALTELGPVYIKLGQLLSTRPDVVPIPIAQELAALQDTVPPFPTDTLIGIVEQEIGAPISEAFAQFEREPIAAASIAQVHGAELPTGEPVVVKVVRPGLRDAIQQDMQLFRGVAARLERRNADARRLKLQAVLDDYERTIYAELDMLAEAANTARLRSNFADSDLLYVPRVHQALCRTHVLVMERIEGVPVSDVATLNRLGVDLAVLADKGVQTFFTQVFEDNFFHADMHPGNVYVDVANPENPRYIALDCAIMGTLTEADQTYLAENLLAFFRQDYAAVARLHLESGWVPANTDARAFEQVIRDVCEPIFAKPLSEISFAHFLTELFQTAERFQMEVQPQLVLLQKTLLYIEGLGRQLYPQLDLWETGQPFMERWLIERTGPAQQFAKLIEQAPEFLKVLPRIPAELQALRAAQAEQAQEIQALKTLAESGHRRRRNARLTGGAMVAIGLALLVPDLAAAWATPVGLLSALTGSAILLRPL